MKSTWADDSTSLIGDSDTNRYTYIVVFENASFLLWLVIIFIFPPLANKIKHKMRLVTFGFNKIQSTRVYLEALYGLSFPFKGKSGILL